MVRIRFSPAESLRTIGSSAAAFHRSTAEEAAPHRADIESAIRAEELADAASRTPPTSSSSRILSRPWKTFTRRWWARFRASRFGLAFCEASGKRLVRWSGNDEAALALARDNALAIGAGHTFLIFLGDGFFPVNVLAAVRAVPEVCRIYCATANPTQVIVAQTELGRGVLGVVDGASPLGVETDADIEWRKDLLRRIGYKL